MRIDTTKTPNPGSDEAVEQGCTCPRMDNGYGKGYMGMEGVFVYTENCPVHATAAMIVAEEVGL